MSATRPVAGIICCTRTVGIEPAQAVMNRYVAGAMQYADVAALLVPSMPQLMKASEVAARLDGLMLTGSPSNLDPALYGEEIGDAPGPFDLARDTMTADLIKAMLDLGRSLGCEEWWVGTEADNVPARRLYETFGEEAVLAAFYEFDLD